MLQPHLARRRRRAAGGEEQRERRVDARADAPRRVHRGDEEDDHHRIEKEPLHEAERAGLEPLHVLQVIAVAEERGADDGNGHARTSKAV
jgi:hypothetical protein